MAMLSSRRWPEETAALRALVMEQPFTEAVKWAKPCFMVGGKNVLLIQGFNDSIALMFFQGALLKDEKKLLVKIGQQHVPRQLRFADLAEIHVKSKVIRAYVAEAFAHAQAGTKVDLKERPEREVPVELAAAFRKTPGLKKAFEALTPGRQRFYLFHFAEPKQEKTREARVAKSVERILAGKGLGDR